MVRVIGPRSERVGYYINTTSKSPTWSIGLSPFFLGPIALYGDYVSRNMENAWQYAKVYPQFVDPITQEPLANYWAWAEHGWGRDFADRYPMGKGVVPLYSLWDGKKLSYVEARKEIYIPLYSRGVRNTEAYEKLESLYKQQGNITLWDFDGYDHRPLGMSYDDVVNCSTKKMGHAFVLAMMLEGYI